MRKARERPVQWEQTQNPGARGGPGPAARFWANAGVATPPAPRAPPPPPPPPPLPPPPLVPPQNPRRGRGLWVRGPPPPPATFIKTSYLGNERPTL